MPGRRRTRAVGELIDTPYGFREFAFRDPEGTLLRVGSPLSG